MQDVLGVVVPVFLVIGFGYVAAAMGWFSQAGVDGLMRFTQSFAIPCLLFQAMVGLDLGAEFEPALLGSFYAGALSGFAAGLAMGRFWLGRSWEDAVAIGFCGLFSNSVLLGLPITERAYGADALAANYAIITLHTPFCYGVGILAMEVARGAASGEGTTLGIAAKVVRGMAGNALVIGIALGLAVNLMGLPVPGAAAAAIDLMARAALPAALFGLGGVLVRYRPAGDLRAIAGVCAASLVLHPTVTYGLGRGLALPEDALRSSVLTAAMAPGVNTFIFADLYGRGRRVAASGVLIGTALSLLTVTAWLAVLG